MKQCQSCGKILMDNSDVFTLNGRTECQSCASKNYQLRKQKKPMQTYVNTQTAKDVSNFKQLSSIIKSGENTAASFLKVISVIQLVINIMVSFASWGIIDSNLYIEDGAILLVVFLEIIVAVVIFAIEFVILNIASDVSKIRAITIANLQNDLNHSDVSASAVSPVQTAPQTTVRDHQQPTSETDKHLNV